jgi:hypothetical protein
MRVSGVGFACRCDFAQAFAFCFGHETTAVMYYYDELEVSTLLHDDHLDQLGPHLDMTEPICTSTVERTVGRVLW